MVYAKAKGTPSDPERLDPSGIDTNTNTNTPPPALETHAAPGLVKPAQRDKAERTIRYRPSLSSGLRRILKIEAKNANDVNGTRTPECVLLDRQRNGNEFGNDNENDNYENRNGQGEERKLKATFTRKRFMTTSTSSTLKPKPKPKLATTEKPNTNTNTNINAHTLFNTHSTPKSSSSSSSHKRTSSTATTSSSLSTTFRRKPNSEIPRPRRQLSRRSVSRHRRSSEHHQNQHRRKNHHHPLAIAPHVVGVYTPILPPELWAEILRFAGAAVDVDVDLDVGDAEWPVSGSSSSSSCAAAPTSSTSLSASAAPASASAATSFLTYQQHHTHFSTRLERYKAGLKFKADLTRVCRLFHWLGQEVLYAHIWISKRKEGRMLAGRLCGDGGVGSAWGGGGGPGGGGGGEWGMSSVISSGSAKVKKSGKVGKGKQFFGWLWRRKVVPESVSASAYVATESKTRTRTRTTSSSSSVSPVNVNVGHFIRRLRIETPSLDKCSPHDLLIILQYSTRLQEFFDYRSVQRPMHPLALSSSDVVPFSSFSSISSPPLSMSSSSSSASAQVNTNHHHHHHLLTPDALLHTLFSRPLKRLSWTNYDHQPMDVVRGVKYYEDVVGPRLMLDGVGKGLEFLEISMSCSEVLFGSGAGVGWRAQEGIWGVDVHAGGGPVTWPSSSSSTTSAPMAGINSMLLTELTASYTTTTTHSSPSADPSALSSSSSMPSIDGQVYTLSLPSLLSLKVTLDNATFTALSKWDMPRLTHLSVMSADFGYAAEGFRLFFEVHGWKIVQLELGHSSEDIEEAWVTSRPGHSHSHSHSQTPSQTDGPFSIPLDRWCPALHTFICSADAEWNWQSPDWIAPHVLLPTHAGLEVIGVRDMERRLKGDANDAARRRRADIGVRMGGMYGGVDDEEEEEDPYFMLFEQFGSLLRKEAFPSLKYVRDMSRESDAIRKSGRLDLKSSPTSVSVSASEGLSGTSMPSFSSLRAFAASSSNSYLTKSRKMSQAARIARKEKELACEQGRRVLRFWEGVLDKCGERGVGLLDWRGAEVTLVSLGSPLDS